jgi:hypothetical protein
MRNATHLQILTICAIYLVGQMVTGTSVVVALLFSLAILFGLYSIFAAGGLLTAFGALNAILIAKFLLIGILLKTMFLDPADKNLLAPQSTAAVMAIGFLGLLFGTSLQRRLPTPRSSLIRDVSQARMYLALTIVFLVFGYGGYLVGLGPELAGEGLQTGGILGIARVLAGFKSFAIVPALYFAWARQGKRFMTHPLVLAVLLTGFIAGILTTSKLEAMEPLAYYLLVGVLRYGIGDKRLWALAGAGIFYYSAIIYPYSQYVRFNGGRQGSLSDRVMAMRDVFWLVSTNDEFRQVVSTKIDGKSQSYLGRQSLEPFSRLAMVGEADRLISATNQQQALTGWETITWGFKLALPSFLYPDKPVWGTGNYLAHYAGELGSHDSQTQVSYGVMANFYNAFSYPGVFFGSIAFFAGFYYILRFFFKNPRWKASPTGATLWFLLLVAMFQHSLVEESVAGLIASISLPLVVLAIYASARLLSPFLPKFAAPHEVRYVPQALLET